MELRAIDPRLIIWVGFNVLLIGSVLYWIFRQMKGKNQRRR